MLTLKVDVKFDKNILKRQSGRIMPTAHGVIDNLTNVGHALAQQFAPVDTGALRESIVKKVETRGDMVIGTITSNPIEGVSYNIYQEFGIGQLGAANVLHERAKGSPKNPMDGISYNPDIRGFGAQPFMYPTYVFIEKTYVPQMVEKIKEVFNK